MEQKQVSKEFANAIKQYLDKRAAEDPAFAVKLQNPKKSIEECCLFIVGEVQESGRCGFADEEIFGMATHYYDEENLTIKELKGSFKVVINRSVELSQEEIESAKKAAYDKVVAEQVTKLKGSGKPKPKQEKEEQPAQQSLFGDLFW